jgi:hypothetical protein
VSESFVSEIVEPSDAALVLTDDFFGYRKATSSATGFEADAMAERDSRQSSPL